MAGESQNKETLIQKIKTKRAEIKAFISKVQPRYQRLVNTGIICSAIAAAAAVGPALGGKEFSDWLTNSLGSELPIWQVLCLLAALCSITAAISTNMSKSHETNSQILKAQVGDAKLEGLETLLELEQIDLDQGSKMYVQYLNELSFL